MSSGTNKMAAALAQGTEVPSDVAAKLAALTTPGQASPPPEPEEPAAPRPARRTRARDSHAAVEFELVESASTRQLGMRISERLAMRLDLAAMKGKLAKTPYSTGRAIVEAAITEFLERHPELAA